jgi:hypothetical protein
MTSVRNAAGLRLDCRMTTNERRDRRSRFHVPQTSTKPPLNWASPPQDFEAAKEALGGVVS